MTKETPNPEEKAAETPSSAPGFWKTALKRLSFNSERPTSPKTPSRFSFRDKRLATPTEVEDSKTNPMGTWAKIKKGSRDIRTVASTTAERGIGHLHIGNSNFADIDVNNVMDVHAHAGDGMKTIGLPLLGAAKPIFADVAGGAISHLKRNAEMRRQIKLEDDAAKLAKSPGPIRTGKSGAPEAEPSTQSAPASSRKDAAEAKLSDIVPQEVQTSNDNAGAPKPPGKGIFAPTGVEPFLGGINTDRAAASPSPETAMPNTATSKQRDDDRGL